VRRDLWGGEDQSIEHLFAIVVLDANPTFHLGRAVVEWQLGDHRYVIQRSPNGSSSWATINDGVRNTTGYTVTGLTNGTRDYFRVYARNAAGQSPASTVASAIPRTITFGAGGTYRVGIDIPAVLYRASGNSDPSTWCYWERLSGFSRDFDDIIANDFIDSPIAPFYVQILSSDVGFFTDPGCGTYTNIG
jgi:hypothetical protein